MDAMIQRSRDWVHEFLHDTARGRDLLAELEGTEQRLHAAAGQPLQERYAALSDCWLRILSAACEYSATATACDYVAVLKRFQQGMQGVMQELGTGLDAISPDVSCSTPSPSPQGRHVRDHLWIIDGSPGKLGRAGLLGPDGDTTRPS
jgi:hypothetical protein